MKNPVFDGVRIKDNEFSAQFKINIEIDKTHPINYEKETTSSKTSEINEFKVDILKETFKLGQQFSVADQNKVDLQESVKQQQKNTQQSLFEKRMKLIQQNDQKWINLKTSDVTLLIFKISHPNFK